MYMDVELYSHIKDPLYSVRQFFLGPVSSMMRLERTDDDEVIMDVGCGAGNLSTRSILKLFESTENRIVAVDLQPHMIDSARANNSHSRVEYSVADIEDWPSVAKWENQISKLFAIHVIQWVKEQKRSFENMWRLMKPGGVGVVFTVLNSTFFQTCLELKKDPKWSEYLKDVDDCVALSHIEKYEPEHYTDMLKEIGFTIEYCKAEVKEDTFPSDYMLREFFSSICVLLPHIPDNLKDNFKDCIFDTLLKMNGRVDGQAVHRGTMMELIVRKN